MAFDFPLMYQIWREIKFADQCPRVVLLLNFACIGKCIKLTSNRVATVSTSYKSPLRYFFLNQCQGGRVSNKCRGQVRVCMYMLRTGIGVGGGGGGVAGAQDLRGREAGRELGRKQNKMAFLKGWEPVVKGMGKGDRGKFKPLVPQHPLYLEGEL